MNFEVCSLNGLNHNTCTNPTKNIFVACILGFFGLPLPKPFYLFYFLPLDFSNSFNPGWVVFVARFPICNYIFTSIAENRYSHSHS